MLVTAALGTITGGNSLINEVLDLSPLPRLRTLRLLVRLVHRHLITNA